jgi:hypothetical protein
MGTCKVRNEIETKPIETKRNQSKRNETDRNETKPKSKPNETKIKNQNEMKNLSLRVSDYSTYLDNHYWAAANLF